MVGLFSSLYLDFILGFGFMYAVFQTGGKQYRAEKGDVIHVEKLEAIAGDDITLDKVLMAGTGANTIIGAPFVKGGAVKAKILEQKRDAKILVFKKRRRKSSKRLKGHRQYLTVLRITDIIAPDLAKGKA